MKKFILSLVFVAAIVMGSAKTTSALICFTVICTNDSIHTFCYNAPSSWYGNLNSDQQQAAAQLIAEAYC